MPQSQESLNAYGLQEVTPWTPWTQVNSSNIGAIRYNGATKKLQIAFLSGNRYEYDDVEYSTYQNFLDAPSKGQFFFYAIRQTGYTYRQA